MGIVEALRVAFLNSIWILLLVSAVLCSVGFYKFIYFISIGYGFAIAGEGITLIILFADQMNGMCLISCVLLIIYGIRLGGFLFVRERKSASYRNRIMKDPREKKSRSILLNGIVWITVSILYVMMVSPLFYQLENGKGENAFLWIGVMIMALGILVEAVADRQKSKAKEKRPNNFCDKGLYKIVRCPNYLGEVVFWTGVFVSGLGSMKGIFQWLFAILGYLSILYIMLSGARRLELRQNQQYGEENSYKEYIRKTPILIPFTSLYSLGKYAFIKI